MRSALYEGRVRHGRHVPRPHAFQFRLFQVYLDLDELDRAFLGTWLASTRRPAPLRFRRADYHGDPDVPLDEAVRDTLEHELGERPAGPVRLLAHLRTFGYVFNPVAFYYAFEPDGETLHSVLAEITNTPWGERHAYALRSADGRVAEGRFPKAFHVSPFFDLDQEYRWRLTVPGERVQVHMENREGGRPVFHADLDLARRPIRGLALARALVRYPALTAVVHGAIYWQALRLWLKRTPFFVHPRKRTERVSTPGAPR